MAMALMASLYDLSCEKGIKYPNQTICLPITNSISFESYEKCVINVFFALCIIGPASQVIQFVCNLQICNFSCSVFFMREDPLTLIAKLFFSFHFIQQV